MNIYSVKREAKFGNASWGPNVSDEILVLARTCMEAGEKSTEREDGEEDGKPYSVQYRPHEIRLLGKLDKR